MDTFLKKPPETTDLIGNSHLSTNTRDEVPVHKNLNLQLTRTLKKHSLFTQTRDEIIKINLPLKEQMDQIQRTQIKRVSNKNKLQSIK